jgi:glutathione peroxidase
VNPFKIFIATLFTPKAKVTMDLNSIYDLKINNIQGKAVDLKQFKDKFILFVNVASKCGFTSQYKDLQKLHEVYGHKLQVIGVPCNQFGKQEPGSANEIESFCQVNYGVSFLITEKIDVKGKNQHPIYKWLTNKTENGVSSSTVKWNFQKYLLNDKGEFVDYYYSTTNPISQKIIKHLK